MELFLTRFIPTKKIYASVEGEGCVFELGYSGYALWVRYNLYISAKTCLVVRAFYWRLFGEHVCPPSQRYVFFGYFNECNIAMDSSLFVNELVCRHLSVSKNRVFTPQIIHFNRVFHYKPSILGYPYFWKHPYVYIYTWNPTHLTHFYWRIDLFFWVIQEWKKKPKK